MGPARKEGVIVSRDDLQGLEERIMKSAQRFGLGVTIQTLGILAGEIRRNPSMSLDDMLALIEAMQGGLAKEMPPKEEQR